MKQAVLAVAVLAVAGCGGGGVSSGPGSFGGLLDRVRGGAAEVVPAAVVPVPEEVVTGQAEARDIAPTDSTTRAAAVAEGDTEAGDSVRGFTVASLGDATQPGLWIETPLVARERAATVVAPDGTTVDVTARPSGGERGSGSRLSLAAFQALGLNLTSLPTVTVIAE